MCTSVHTYMYAPLELYMYVYIFMCMHMYISAHTCMYLHVMQVSALQKAHDFIRAFLMGFEVRDVCAYT